jgi:hypothetical protein
MSFLFALLNQFVHRFELALPLQQALTKGLVVYSTPTAERLSVRLAGASVGFRPQPRLGHKNSWAAGDVYTPAIGRPGRGMPLCATSDSRSVQRD